MPWNSRRWLLCSENAAVPSRSSPAVPLRLRPGLDLFDAGHLTSVTQNLTKAIRFYKFGGGQSARPRRCRPWWRLGPSRRPGLDDRRPVLVLGRTALRLDGPPASGGDELRAVLGRRPPLGPAATRRAPGSSPGADTATSTGSCRCTAGRKNEQRCGSSAALTQIPAASASSNTCCCVVVGGREHQPRAVEVAGPVGPLDDLDLPRARHHATPRRRQARRRSPRRRRRGVPRPCVPPRRRLRRRARACPTGAGRPGRPSFHRGAGDQPLGRRPDRPGPHAVEPDLPPESEQQIARRTATRHRPWRVPRSRSGHRSAPPARATPPACRSHAGGRSRPFSRPPWVRRRRRT